MISLTRLLQVMILMVCCAMPVPGSVGLLAETPSDATPESMPPKAKEPEVKPKESEVKPKEPEGKSKEPEAKPKESEVKPQDTKSKDNDQKPKEAEPKPKESDSKQREPESKPKEGTKKDADSKANQQEQKAKEAEQKPKDAELSERPCPQVHQASEGKVAQDSPPPADPAGGDKPKAAESEVKKAVRSPMVTAKLALMADPRLFPYDIEVDSKDKDLVLLGKVVSENDKHAATDIVRCLEGVHAVENRMKVEADASHGLAAERDKVITQLVKERFEKSKTLQSIKFDIKTEHGIVYLAGSTRFQVIILEAAQAARQVPGVKAVNTEAVRIVAGE